jgi:hypothetical protein
VVRDRDEKADDFEGDSALAGALCAGDTDGDFVPNGVDACPTTPPLTPTNAVGCTDATLPAAPSGTDVQDILDKFGVAFNSACSKAKLLPKGSIGALFRPSDLPGGMYVFAGRVTNQPPGCPVWYIFEIEAVEPSINPPGYNVIERFRVAFKDSEEITSLMGRPAPVPAGVIQFNAQPGQEGTRGQLGTLALQEWAGTISKARIRVDVMNGAGMRAGWSDWRFTDDPRHCRILGLDCL